MLLYVQLIKVSLKFSIKVVSMVDSNGVDTELFRSDICHDIVL